MTEEEEVIPGVAKRQEQVLLRRASTGRMLVALAVFAPALLILGLFLLSKGNIYSHPFPGPKWPWIVADVVLLLLGMGMMRGEDL